MYYYFLFLAARQPLKASASCMWSLDNTQRRTTVHRSSLDRCSVHTKDLYLHNTQHPQETHSCPRRGSNPQSQQATGRSVTPWTVLSVGSALIIISVITANTEMCPYFNYKIFDCNRTVLYLQTVSVDGIVKCPCWNGEWAVLAGEVRRTGWQTWPNTTLSTTEPGWTDLGSNTGFSHESSVTNCPKNS